MTRNVAVLVYDQVEVLDFAGPFEVFSTAARVRRRREPQWAPPFAVFTVAEGVAEVTARGGLTVRPHFDLGDHPPMDILVVPGGVVDEVLERERVVHWLAESASRAQITASVCTGAFLLAKAGLLAGRSATTHWEDMEEFARRFPDIRGVGNRRWVDEGSVVTSAGISAGIDMSLHLVERLEGEELARLTARQMDCRGFDEEPTGSRQVR